MSTSLHRTISKLVKLREILVRSALLDKKRSHVGQFVTLVHNSLVRQDPKCIKSKSWCHTRCVANECLEQSAATTDFSQQRHEVFRLFPFSLQMAFPVRFSSLDDVTQLERDSVNLTLKLIPLRRAQAVCVDLCERVESRDLSFYPAPAFL